MSSAGEIFLYNLIDVVGGVKILAKMEIIDLAQLSNRTSLFLRQLVSLLEDEHINEFFKKIEAIDLTRLNESEIKLIEFLITAGHTKKILEKIASYSGIRREFDYVDISDFPDKDILWPSLNKQILKMPLSLKTTKKLRGGWYSVELKKDGSI